MTPTQIKPTMMITASLVAYVSAWYIYVSSRSYQLYFFISAYNGNNYSKLAFTFLILARVIIIDLETCSSLGIYIS